MKKLSVALLLAGVGCGINADDAGKALRGVTVAGPGGKAAVVVNARVARSERCQAESDWGKDAQKRFEAKRDSVGSEFQKREQTLMQAASEHNSKAPTMSDTARRESEERLLKDERALKNDVEEFKNDLTRMMQTESVELQKNFSKSIEKCCKGKYSDSIVFDANAVLYAPDELDITGDVIATMNDLRKTELAKQKTIEQPEHIMVKADDKHTSASASA